MMLLIKMPMISLKTLFEDNLTQLRQNIERGFPRTKKRQKISNTVSISNIRYTAYPMQHAVQVEASARGSTGNYEPIILFTDVEFQEADTPNVITFKAINGEEYHVSPVSRRMNNVEMSCDCMDYQWRFASQNYQKDTQFGQPPPPYQRKTPLPPAGRPYANPMEVSGMCKHMVRFADQLQQVGLLIP